MAEARLAVAFQFQLTDEGEFVIHIDRRIFIDIWRSAVRVVKRKVLKGRNAFMQVNDNHSKTDFHILVSCEVNTVREVNLMFELVIHRAFSLLLLGPYCSLQYCWELYSIGENLRTG